MDNNKMNICVTVSSLYMKYLYVMLQSLYENNELGSIHLYVLHRDYTQEDKDYIIDITKRYNNEVDFIYVDPQKYDVVPDTFKKNNNLSVVILFRLSIPELLPENIDRVLLLDVDLVINKNISEMYNTDFEDCVFAAVPNIGANCQIMPEFRAWYPQNRSHWTHYNTGVLLWNLKKIREEYPYEYLLKCGENHTDIKKPQFDEELLNVEFGEHLIKPLAYEWNYQSRVVLFNRQNTLYKVYKSIDEIRRECGIIHYVDANPWVYSKRNFCYDIWWEYCAKTPFFTAIQDIYHASITEFFYQKDMTIKYLAILGHAYRMNIVVRRIKLLGASNIVLYNVNRVTQLLYNTLHVRNVKVSSVIDDKENTFYDIKDCPVIKSNELTESDKGIVIVPNALHYEEAKNKLSKNKNLEVICIDEIIEMVSWEEKLGRYIKSDKNVTVYGAGGLGKKLVNNIKTSELFNLIGWYDKNYANLDNEVQSPELISEANFDYIIIAISNKKTANKIIEELKGKGIDSNKIIWIERLIMFV